VEGCTPPTHGSYPGCRWVSTGAGGAPNVAPGVRVAGPAATYRLGGQPLVNQDMGYAPFPLTDVVLPALPTPDYFTLKDYRSWFGLPPAVRKTSFHTFANPRD